MLMPYLFSYGSNNLPQLKARLDIQNPKIYPAYLPNHMLIFGFYSQKWKGGVASFTKDTSRNLLGNIIYLSKKKIEKLDLFEGIQTHHYRRITKIVKYYKLGKWKSMTVSLYQLLNPKFISLPSRHYLSSCLVNIQQTWDIKKIIVRDHHLDILAEFRKN
jgi:hypothetical protein